MSSKRESDVQRAVIIFSPDSDMGEIRGFLSQIQWILEREEGVHADFILSKDITCKSTYNEAREVKNHRFSVCDEDDLYLRSLSDAEEMAEGCLVEPEFLLELRANDRADSTLKFYRNAVESLSFLGKDPRDMSETDLIKWLLRLKRDYAESTAYKYQCCVKRYFRWLRSGNLNAGSYPGCVEWLDIGPNPRFSFKDVLSREDIERMADAAERQRDRTLLWVGYESGARPGELLGIKLGDVQFDRYGALVTVDGKTGKRKIRLVESAPELKRWLDAHPEGDNPEAALCWSQKGGSLARYSWSRILKGLASKAGIEKRVHPYLLRHSRVTHLAGKSLNEAQLREIFGWSRGSDMPFAYIHMSGRIMDEVILNLYGVDTI